VTTAVYTHKACLEHDPGSYHPESPARLGAVLKSLKTHEFSPVDFREAPLATTEAIARAHRPEYVDHVLAAMPETGYVALDGDTTVSPGSREAALRAAGALCVAVDAVMAGEADTAFCAVRPPGHHAEAVTAMGFCVFNNIAIGVQHARQVHRLERVAVVDFDVHHGNGTQHIFERDKGVFFASTHQMPLYPGTGAASERGVGNVVNAPLPPGAGGSHFREAMRTTILPALEEFAPQFLLISAGFDAHEADPLANLRFATEDYAWVTGELCALAQRCCDGRVVSTLEGGYDLGALGASAAAHVQAMMAA
jgi:acetoin utilization deacetylase AcuC-like enzyme